jgi:hypothetical protein
MRSSVERHSEEAEKVVWTSGARAAKPSWLQACHIRDESSRPVLTELVNAQFRHSFAENWGDGTTSSSDGHELKVAEMEKSGSITSAVSLKPAPPKAQ